MWYTRLHDDGYPSHPNTNRSHAMNDATQSRQGKYRDSGRKEQEGGNARVLSFLLLCGG